VKQCKLVYFAGTFADRRLRIRCQQAGLSGIIIVTFWHFSPGSRVRLFFVGGFSGARSSLPDRVACESHYLHSF
jgi:hypothetical protein